PDYARETIPTLLSFLKNNIPSFKIENTLLTGLVSICDVEILTAVKLLFPDAFPIVPGEVRYKAQSVTKEFLAFAKDNIKEFPSKHDIQELICISGIVLMEWLKENSFPFFRVLSRRHDSDVCVFRD